MGNSQTTNSELIDQNAYDLSNHEGRTNNYLEEDGRESNLSLVKNKTKEQLKVTDPEVVEIIDVDEESDLRAPIKKRRKFILPQEVQSADNIEHIVNNSNSDNYNNDNSKNDNYNNDNDNNNLEDGRESNLLIDKNNTQEQVKVTAPEVIAAVRPIIHEIIDVDEECNLLAPIKKRRRFNIQPQEVQSADNNEDYANNSNNENSNNENSNNDDHNRDNYNPKEQEEQFTNEQGKSYSNNDNHYNDNDNPKEQKILFTHEQGKSYSNNDNANNENYNNDDHNSDNDNDNPKKQKEQLTNEQGKSYSNNDNYDNDHHNIDNDNPKERKEQFTNEQGKPSAVENTITTNQLSTTSKPGSHQHQLTVTVTEANLPTIDFKQQTAKYIRSRSSHIELDISPIRSYLTCELCQGIYREPYTVSECLHTFCKSCIIKSICLKVECPTCNVSLEPDPYKVVLFDRTIQEIIDVLLPELQKYDEEAEKEFYAERKIQLRKEYREVVATDTNKVDDENDLSQNTNTLNFSAESKLTMDNKSDNYNPNDTSITDSQLYQQQVDELNILLQPYAGQHQPLPPLEKELLRTSGRVKILHLKRYLIKQLSLEGITSADIEFLCNGSPVGDELCLIFIQKTRWLNPTELILKYRLFEDDIYGH